MHAFQRWVRCMPAATALGGGDDPRRSAARRASADRRGSWVSRRLSHVAEDGVRASEVDAVQIVEYLQKSAAEAIVHTLDAPLEGFGGWWYDGVLSPHDGCLYYMPGGANRVLKFDPGSGKRELVGGELLEKKDLSHKWMGGVLGSD
eukprot:1330448-Prymnesium_polylepis.1